jgi:tetratricopeptide (TPR) repeat protein
LLPLKDCFLLAKELRRLTKKRQLLPEECLRLPARQQDIFFAVPARLENNARTRRESARARNTEELAMNDCQRLLLPICGGLLALALLLKCGERKGRLRHLLSLVIVLAAAAVIYLGKDEKAVWIPALAALLVAAAQEVLKWQPADGSGAAADQTGGMRQYEEELKTLRQQILALQASGAMADDKQRQLLEAQLQAVQEHLADIRESWKEEQLRRKAADEALDQMKCQMPEARIAEAKLRLAKNDTKAAKETFAEVRRQAGKAAALAAYHEGKLAEGEVKYAEAMELYRTAVLLEKDNQDYLLAAGKMARKLAEYKQAQEWLERLLELREAEGKNDAALGDALHELALLHKDLGQYAAAEPLHLRAVAVKEQALGKEHPDVAEVLNDLAVLYWREGKYAESEPLYLRALAVKEQAFGKEHLSVAQTLNDFAILLEAQGRLAEAESLYLHSLDIREKNLGKDHLDVTESLNNLAGLYRKQERYAEAEKLHFRALTIREAVLGKDHPRVATTINNLSFLYKKQGRFEEAELMYLRSLAIREQTLGKNHPDVSNSLNNIADLYRERGRYVEAETLHLRSLAIREKSLGKDHPNVAICLNNLAALYRVQCRYEEAKPLLHRALQIREDKLGKDHADVASTLRTLAKLYRDQGRYAEAEPLFQRALSILKEKLPAGHSRIAACQKDYDEMKEKMAGV